MIINAIDNNGNLKEYETILTYHSDEFNKDYIVYTDNIYNQNGELQIYINEYNPEELEVTVKEIIDQEEYKKIKTIINCLLLKMKNESDLLKDK